MFDPSLCSLIFKVVFFILTVGFTGWAILPNPVFSDSRISTWVVRQSVGTSLLLVIGFNLVSFDIPAQPFKDILQVNPSAVHNAKGKITESVLYQTVGSGSSASRALSCTVD